MNVVRKSPLFACALAVCTLLVLGELAFTYERFVASRAAALRLADRETTLDRISQLTPPPTRETAAAIQDDLRKAQAALGSMQRELQGHGAVADRFRLARVPVARTDSYFDLATFVEKTRQLAQKHAVDVRPEAARFGFAAFAHEGPVQDHIAPVFRQRLIAQNLLESLIEAGPRSIVSVKREPTISQAEHEARAAALANGEPPAEVQLEEGPDYFTIDPRVSARVPDFIDTTAFQLVFTGQTAALRTFLNRLALFELPILVREVEVNTAPFDEAGDQTPPADVVTPPDANEPLATAASIVLSVDSPAVPGPVSAGAPARTAARTASPSNAVPIVSKPLSRFTITLEFIELVAPAAAPTGQAAPESPVMPLANS